MGISNLFPDKYVSSAYDIDYTGLYESGYRGIIYDIDNTLVEHNAPGDEKAAALVARLHTIGFKVMVLSNNKEPRVKSFAEACGMDSYVYKGNKPAKSGYVRAMEQMGCTTDNTLFVGDQIFTDIWGAKRLGILSYMTEPVRKWHEEPQIILKRIIEMPILFLYRLFRHN